MLFSVCTTESYNSITMCVVTVWSGQCLWVDPCLCETTGTTCMSPYLGPGCGQSTAGLNAPWAVSCTLLSHTKTMNETCLLTCMNTQRIGITVITTHKVGNWTKMKPVQLRSDFFLTLNKPKIHEAKIILVFGSLKYSFNFAELLRKEPLWYTDTGTSYYAVKTSHIGNTVLLWWHKVNLL